jgi:hypothetical protein
MYAWMLAPLFRRGRVEEAQELDARLGSLLAYSPRYLESLGCRIEFAALQGRFDDAWNLVDGSWEMAVDPEVSAWQRLRYFQKVQRAFQLAHTPSSEASGGGRLDKCEVRMASDHQVTYLGEQFAKRTD